MPKGIPMIAGAAVASGLWSVSLSLASRAAHALVGPLVVELTGAAIAAIVLGPRLRDLPAMVTPRGWAILLSAGLFVFLVDYLSMRAYATGLPVTVGAPIVIGGSILVATVIGTLMGDAMSVRKLIGIITIVTGAIILATAGDHGHAGNVSPPGHVPASTSTGTS